jgi:hypothetical protein
MHCLLQLWQPSGNEVNVFQEQPLALFRTFLEQIQCSGSLVLAHRYLQEIFLASGAASSKRLSVSSKGFSGML